MQKLCCVRTRQHPLPVWSHKFVISSPTHISTNSRPFLVGIVSVCMIVHSSSKGCIAVSLAPHFLPHCLDQPSRSRPCHFLSTDYPGSRLSPRRCKHRDCLPPLLCFRGLPLLGFVIIHIQICEVMVILLFIFDLVVLHSWVFISHALSCRACGRAHTVTLAHVDADVPR